jgi:hypothetical protein
MRRPVFRTRARMYISEMLFQSQHEFLKRVLPANNIAQIEVIVP